MRNSSVCNMSGLKKQLRENTKFYKYILAGIADFIQCYSGDRMV